MIPCVILYECDPEKNKECRKSWCGYRIAGIDRCYLTTKKEICKAGQIRESDHQIHGQFARGGGNMKIVIDIPAEDFEKVKCGRSAVSMMRKAIIHGAPLPKGHGRLIDADKIISEATERMKYPANHKYMECVIAHMNLAPTIIEADKAESEDVE